MKYISLTINDIQSQKRLKLIRVLFIVSEDNKRNQVFVGAATLVKKLFEFWAH
jgi:hypothetical protein